MDEVAAHPRYVRQPRRDGSTGGPVIACIGHGQDGRATRRVAASLAGMLRCPLLTASIGQPDGSAASAPTLLAGTVAAGEPSSARRVALGEPAEQLAILADHHAAQLLVVPTPDPSAPAPPPLGSVYLALAGAGSWPVVVVPPGVQSLASGGPIVCGVDGSGSSLTAARVVARLADSIGAALHLVKAIDPREGSGHDFDAIRTVASIATSQRLRRSAHRSSVPSMTKLLVQEGAAADLLVATAQRDSALLLAVGSRGRSSTVGSLLGSVASAVALTAGTPVLIVCSRADRSHATPFSVRGV
jgi:nucleotide-binding universal stress UspA family protein